MNSASARTLILALAAAGLLTSAVVASVAAAALQIATLRPPVTEGKRPLLPVAERSRGPSRTPDVGRSPIGIHGGSGVRIFVPPDLFEKKAKIPAPVYCVVPIKVGKAEVVPMSALPPPGICNGIQQQALVNAVGSQSGNAAGKVAMYCISCKYGFLNWKGKPHPIHVNYLDGVGQGKGSQSLINKVLQCYRCQSNYVWNAAKGKCCKNPNK